ncbi:MAG: hypothetical protein ABH879_09615 [archaeon]
MNKLTIRPNLYCALLLKFITIVSFAGVLSASVFFVSRLAGFNVWQFLFDTIDTVIGVIPLMPPSALHTYLEVVMHVIEDYFIEAAVLIWLTPLRLSLTRWTFSLDYFQAVYGFILRSTKTTPYSEVVHLRYRKYLGWWDFGSLEVELSSKTIRLPYVVDVEKIAGLLNHTLERYKAIQYERHLKGRSTHKASG